MAPPVLAFALCSSYFPNRMNEISIATMLNRKREPSPQKVFVKQQRETVFAGAL